MINRFLEWGEQDISFGDFIGLAFVSCMITMALCLSLLIIVDVLIKCGSIIDQVEIILLETIFKTRQPLKLQTLSSSFFDIAPVFLYNEFIVPCFPFNCHVCT
jgi:hypothetical protein